MFRDRIRAALAALRAAPGGAWRAALAHAPRVRRVAAAFAAACSAAWAATRRRPDAVLAAVLLLGVFLMVLHWRGAPIDPEPMQREPAAQHAVGGP